jgi:hypothetical protein
MNALSVTEECMDDDGRIIRLETEMGRVRSDIQELRVSVDGVKTELHGFREDVANGFGFFRADVAREFGSFRADMAKEVGSFRADMAKEVGSFRADMTKEFGSVRADMAEELGSVRADMATESGSLRTEMATQFGALNTTLERYARWAITAGLGIAATLITMFATVAHALKWF